MSVRGTLFIIAAPSGAGKTSLVSTLTESDDKLVVSVSHVTRPIRPGEENGKNYFFVDEQEFNNLIEQGAFLEHARVFDHYYGTTKAWVEQQLSNGLDVILEIDWQGAAQVRALIPESVSIFILPPSLATLEERLTNRRQDSSEVIARRLQEASLEMSHYKVFDYLVINDQFEQALHEMRSIVTSQRLRTTRQAVAHHALLKELKAES